MLSALWITAKDLRLRLRDRSAIVIGFLVPFGLAGIFSLTLANVDEEEDLSATYAIVDLDGGEASAGFEHVLASLDFAGTRDVRDVAEGERLAQEGELDAVFVFPERFSDDVAAGRGAEIRVISDPRSSIGGLIARSVARAYASDLGAVQLSVATAIASGAPRGDAAAIAGRASSSPPVASLERDTAESRSLTATSFYAIGMAVFFVFFTVEFGVRSLLDEREGGTLARLLVAPLRPAWIVGGKVLAGFVVGVVSLVALVVATSAFIDASWGEPVGVALMVLAGVASAVGVTALVATLAKTPQQAGGYTSLVTVVLGLFGGTFFPLSQASFLGTLSLLTPQAWMMRGFLDLGSGGSIVDVLAPVAALLAFTAVTGAVAVVRSRRLIAR